MRIDDGRSNRRNIVFAGVDIVLLILKSLTIAAPLRDEVKAKWKRVGGRGKRRPYTLS